MRLSFLPAVALAALLACGRSAGDAPVDPAFAAGWREWHTQRLERLRAPAGWLSLTGLHWLAPGENRIAGLPGVWVLADGKVTLRAAATDGYTLDGAPVTERTLAADVSARPERVALGTRLVEVVDRSGKLGLRVRDAEAPARKAFQGVPAFPPDPRWRLVARWEPYPAPRKVTVPAAAGPAQEGLAPGRAHFTVGGREVTLEPTSDGDALLFVFRDETARDATYGAGRFLVADAPRDGRVVLDFNRAYNPPCAFTAHATCPLPRPENVLPVRIEAGEKRVGSH